ncbi:hypothetical protein F3Y22_tig00110332pilonHSYRG01342 [Hibiscus syriacus]|uniref:Uncharacterized protein n=1 Tax=Hibiscus syriacus TaxID=106335 RepID=A0A6A3AXU6_HIBSY|nr:hypothetical protein F3Y22_tig00110332pilonHSYRG01342 [Hibiscus syriacus]
MDDYYRRSHVPAFGTWDWNNARQAALLRYTSYSQDRDLYVAGDLYQNDVVTPAVIMIHRSRGRARQSHIKEDKKQSWEEAPMPRPKPKPVDEDLYKISPVLYAKPKKVLSH